MTPDSPGATAAPKIGFVSLGCPKALADSELILTQLRAEGYEIATPIQVQAIPHVLAGRDLVGCAQTGTGKTAAFALPTLQRLSTNGSRPRERGRKIRCLVLSPTRL